jgi:hypothetical protein
LHILYSQVFPINFKIFNYFKQTSQQLQWNLPSEPAFYLERVILSPLRFEKALMPKRYLALTSGYELPQPI